MGAGQLLQLDKYGGFLWPRINGRIKWNTGTGRRIIGTVFSLENGEEQEEPNALGQGDLWDWILFSNTLMGILIKVAQGSANLIWLRCQSANPMVSSS